VVFPDIINAFKMILHNEIANRMMQPRQQFHSFRRALPGLKLRLLEGPRKNLDSLAIPGFLA
jgi:hypothetical protein